MVVRFDQTDERFSSHAIRNVSDFNHSTMDQNESEKTSNFFISRWWNVDYKHQRFIVHTVEKTLFHVIIVLLVLLDCVLVVGELLLDFIRLNQELDEQNKTCQTGEKPEFPKLDLAIEILHYGSITLLAIFVAEVLIKIYGSGKIWWNLKEKKMEWLDAIIVIVSFIIDIYFLKSPNAIAEISLLFISFRLWRIVSIEPNNTIN